MSFIECLEDMLFYDIILVGKDILGDVPQNVYNTSLADRKSALCEGRSGHFLCYLSVWPGKPGHAFIYVELLRVVSTANNTLC